MIITLSILALIFNIFLLFYAERILSEVLHDRYRGLARNHHVYGAIMTLALVSLTIFVIGYFILSHLIGNV